MGGFEQVAEREKNERMENVLRFGALFLLVASGQMEQTREDMEDAFAEDQSEACRPSEVTVFCRFENPLLHPPNSCLCTHLILEEENTSVLEFLRRSNPNIRLMLSVPAVAFVSGAGLRGWLQRISREGYDGVDVILGEETEPESLDILKELGRRLKENSGSEEKQLSLTFRGYDPSSSFLSQITSNIDVTSFSFFSNLIWNETKNTDELERISKLGIPLNKTLLGISLMNLTRSALKTPDDLLPQIKYAMKNDVAGIDIWIPTEILGKGSHRILHFISDTLNANPAPFQHFADLDIILSTGESREQLFWKELDINPKEIGKLPCEHVGFYRHPSDCSKFFHCSEYRTSKPSNSGKYTGVLYKCPHGLVFDEKRGSCIWPSMSDPCQGSSEIMPVSSKKFSCVVPGFHVDPENCRWFYYCSDLGDGRLEAFEFLCPTDLLGFDEEKMLCNWKWTIPVCSSNGKKQETQFQKSFLHDVSQDNKSRKNMQPQNRISKAIRHEDQNPTISQVNRTNIPRSLKLNLSLRQANRTDKNEIYYTTLEHYHSTEEPQQYKTPKSIEHFPRTQQNHYDAKARQENVTGYLPRLGLLNEQQNRTEKKYGTAVWRRSWINNNNNRTITLNPNRPINGFVNKNEGHTLVDENQNKAKQVNLVYQEKNPSTISTENNDETRAFRGVVQKLHRQTHQLPNEQNYLARNASNRGDNKTLPLQHNHNGEQNDIKIFNRALRTNSEHTSFPIKIIPFANVRCSKLETGNEEPDPTNFGCTSEVSLTIQLKPGKDSSKYVLKEDQIKRTDQQEYQKIDYLRHPGSKKNMTRTDVERNVGSKINNTNISTSMKNADTNQIRRNNEPFVLARRVNERPEVIQFDIRNNPNTELYGDDNSSSSLNKVSNGRIRNNDVKSSQANSQEYDEFKILQTSSKRSNDFQVFAQKTEKLINENSGATMENLNKQIANVTVQEKHYNSKSMPMHFYPQGVLLNIDLAHLNEIPPQILLEVDYMLKKYMSEGTIDLNLLEKKLNASMQSMTEKEQESMEPKEITEMIKMIETAIQTSEGKESVEVTNHTSSHNTGDSANSTAIFENAGDTVIKELEYENITDIELNTSIRNFTFNETETNKANDTSDFKKRLTNDKIQITEDSQDVQSNVTSNQKPFGRRRLLRKFRYPSIREQLEKQNEFRNNEETNYKSAADRIVSNVEIPLSFTHPAIQTPTEQERTNGRLDDNFYSDINLGGIQKDYSNPQNERREENVQYGDRLKIEDGRTFQGQIHNNPPSLYTDERIKTYNPRSENTVKSSETTNGDVSRQSNPPTLKFERRKESANGQGKRQENTEIGVSSGTREFNFHYTPPLNLIPFRSTSDAVRSFDDKQFTRGIPVDNDAQSRFIPTKEKLNFDAGTQRRKRKRKLRVLVKKFARDDLIPENETPRESKENYGHTEQRISQNVLNTLKNKLLTKLGEGSSSKVELQIQYQDQVWNIPFVNDPMEPALSPAMCTRAGLFQHPRDCSMFYECFWDKWLQRFTLHVFSCPVRLVYDHSERGCTRPSSNSFCANSAK